jgi:hypothetical protein
MHKSLLALALLSLAGIANAQDAAPDVSIPTPVPAGVENNVNTNSNSESNASSSSQSAAGAYSEGSNQGQSQSQGQYAAQGNAQSTTLVFEGTKIPKETNTTVRTNTAVPLAAAVSFSSDYCGGIVSGGASGFGLSLGASAPKMDGNCQSLRRAEKFGVAAVTARNLGSIDASEKLMAMMVWELCTSESNARRGENPPSTQRACEALALVGAEPIVPEVAAASIQQSQRAEQSVQYPPEAIITGSDGKSVKAFRN